MTRWTAVRLAQAGDEQALLAFVERYRPVVVYYFARRGLDPSLAEDLAQDVFLRVLRDGVLNQADPARGRLRNLIYAVARNMLGDHLRYARAKKRGGGVVASLGSIEVPAPQDELTFDREWLLQVLEFALARLETEHPRYHAAVTGVYLEDASYAQVASSLGKETSAVTNYVYRGKQKLKHYLREAVRDYSASERECSEELEHLSCFLEGRL